MTHTGLTANNTRAKYATPITQGASVDTADIIRAIETIYEEMKEGNVRDAGLSLEILLDDLNGQNPKVSDLSFFRHLGVRDE